MDSGAIGSQDGKVRRLTIMRQKMQLGKRQNSGKTRPAGKSSALFAW
jgi:hypothetical protein